jgi:hyperosmotically inducible protein
MASKHFSWLSVGIAVLTMACAQTDAGITTAVKTKLVADGQINALQIDVDTRDKVVTLSGSVDTETAKSRAVDLASKTDGVTRVVDNLMIAPASVAVPPVPDATTVAYTDTSLTSTVKTKLLADSTVSGLRIDVDTENAVVTLTGEVKSQAEKDQALRLARETDGVKGVTDKLTVRP